MASNIAQGGKRVCIKQTGITVMRFTSGYTSLDHEGYGCNHTRTSPWGAQSMAKPRSREANIDIEDTRFCTYDLIKEDDWNDHPCTQKS